MLIFGLETLVEMYAMCRRLTASSAAAELPALYRLLETWSI
jgi:hypothetical protein